MVAMTACTMVTTIGGTADPHGLFGGFSAAGVVNDGNEIGSYMVILGLFDSGYADYAEAVKKAEAQGKKVATKQTWYYLATKTTAYAK
jgi:hypothetical protein